MPPESAQKLRHSDVQFRGEMGRVSKQMECPDPRDRTEGEFETREPVDSELRRIIVHPTADQPRKTFGITFVAGQPVRLPKNYKKLVTVQLPNDLFIAGRL